MSATNPRSRAEFRQFAYAKLREQGVTVAEAAMRIGISYTTRRSYEKKYQAQRTRPGPVVVDRTLSWLSGSNQPLPGTPEIIDTRKASETERRQAGLFTAGWALDHSRSHTEAAGVLKELLFALGLTEDPQCQWEPKTVTDRWTGRRRRDSDGAA